MLCGADDARAGVAEPGAGDLGPGCEAEPDERGDLARAGEVE